MTVIKIRIPEVGVQPAGEPGVCEGCGNRRWVRWGRYRRQVRDVRVEAVTVERWKCRGCGPTVRVYPEGVGRAQQTERVKVWAALGWGLGLSLRVVAWWMAATAGLGATTVWRDVQEVAAALRRWRLGRVRVLGVDGTGVRYGGKTRGVVVAADMGTGRPVALVEWSERDAGQVVRWLQPLVEADGVEVLKVTEALGVRHPVGRFHRLRWVLRELRERKQEVGRAGWPFIEEAMAIVRSRSPDGGRRRFELWRRMGVRRRRRGKRRRLLWARLGETWHEWLQAEPDVPTTNNRAEPGIRRLKFRARTTRGLKTWAGVEATFG
jgi:hypothetical protein